MRRRRRSQMLCFAVKGRTEGGSREERGVAQRGGVDDRLLSVVSVVSRGERNQQRASKCNALPVSAPFACPFIRQDPHTNNALPPPPTHSTHSSDKTPALTTPPPTTYAPSRRP